MIFVVINVRTSTFLVSPCDSLLDEKLCQVMVKVLGASSSPEVSEMCLELLHGQGENGEFLYCPIHGVSCSLNNTKKIQL
jgi:hypothetical protein